MFQSVHSVIRSDVLNYLTVYGNKSSFFFFIKFKPKLTQRFHLFIRSDGLLTSAYFILISLTMAYVIGRNIALERNKADFL